MQRYRKQLSKILTIFLLTIGFHTFTFSQNVDSSELDHQFITLMVVPNFYNFQDIEQTLTHDKNYQKALKFVSEKLVEDGYIVKDFREMLRINQEKRMLNPHPITDPYRFLIDNAAAAIFIYVDFEIETNNTEKQVFIQLTARDKYTGEVYVLSPSLKSTKRRWPNLYRPIEEALMDDNALDSFSIDLNDKLSYLVEKGRKIELEIEIFHPNLGFNFLLKNDQFLMEDLQSWFHQKAVSTITQEIGSTNKFWKMEVNMPLRNEVGKNCSPSMFGQQLKQYLLTVFEKNNVENVQLDLKTIHNRMLLTIQKP